MTVFLRLTLVGLFIALGVALAFCVVCSTAPSRSRLPEGTCLPDGRPQHVGRIGNSSSHEADPLDGLAIRPTGKPELGLSPIRNEAAELVPQGPIAAAPYPLQAQQVQAPDQPVKTADDPEQLKKAVEAIRPYLARSKPPEPASADSRGPAPAAPEVVPAGRPLGAAGAQKPRVAKIEDEGDGRLSISFKNEDIRNVLEMFSAQGNLNILASNSVQGTVSATLNSVDLDGALQAILHSTGYVSKREGRFVYVGTPQDFATLEQSLDQVGTRVYRPNYVAAADLQALILPLLTKDHGVVSVSKPSEAGIPTETDKAGGNSFSGNEVVLVRDYEAVLTQVDQVVAETDVRPMQVSIESMILSVKLSDTDSFGINWQLLRSNPHLAVALGSPGTSLPTDFSSGGLTFAFLDGNLGAFLTALEELNETNVVATPRLMVMNKQRAEVQIGHSTGYVSATTQTETSTSSQMQTLDTGTILRLRPFISSDGMVRMEVHPEISSGQVTLMGQTLVPDKDITQVTTNVMVRDGCTVIIGGLIQQELDTTGNQIPFLGNLKYIGPLFRNRTQNTIRNEVLILLTPRIVYGPASDREAKQASCTWQGRQAVYADKMSPLGRRSVSRRYLRMAQNALAAGQCSRALRFAELAVQFDPESLEAIDLRNRLCQNGKACAAVAGQPAQPSADPAALDQQALAPWLLDDLERQPPAPPPVQHPLDPGQPGPQKDIIYPRRLQ
jgi:type IV pilus assembly protein PilQ